MKWQVELQVREGTQAVAQRFTVESKSVSMALEKAVQQARVIGLQTLAVCSCNPLRETAAARFF